MNRTLLATLLVGVFLLPTATAAPVACTVGVTCSYEEGVASNQMHDIFSLRGAGDITLTVDTTSSATAFDPWMAVCRDRSATGALSQCFLFADDSVGCTFPPPSYSCPRGTVSLTLQLPNDSDATFWIGVAAHPCCGGSFRTPGNGQYVLRGVATGVAIIDLVADDRAGNLGA